jgi:hypothetical protein
LISCNIDIGKQFWQDKSDLVNLFCITGVRDKNVKVSMLSSLDIVKTKFNFVKILPLYGYQKPNMDINTKYKANTGSVSGPMNYIVVKTHT